jgi:hypothetical protein
MATSKSNDGGGGVEKMKVIRETPTTMTKIKLSLEFKHHTSLVCSGIWRQGSTY